MKRKHADKFREIFKKIGEDKCWERAEKAAKHFLAAVSFRETSITAYEKTGSALLPPIGYYYSVFHMAVALCWLNPKIEEERLKFVGHKSLQNMIKQEFVQTKLLSNSFLILLERLKSEREWSNYVFGEYYYDFFGSVEEDKEHTKREFDVAIQLIHEICDETRHIFDFQRRISTYIADSKGDDFIQTYLSYAERDVVMNYIFENDLSN